MKEKMAPDGESSPGDLRRILSPKDAVMLACGIVVGTGIFAVPGTVARPLGAPLPILAVWVLGGLVALSGSLTYAELASRFPRQGGAFVYVLHAFGPFAAFFKGWGSFLVGYPASSAVVAAILGHYFAVAAGQGEEAARPAAVVAVVLVWLLNLRGTRFAFSLQNVFTAAKLLALVTLGLVAIAIAPAGIGRLVTGPPAGWPGPAAFGAALVGVLWTYDGWGNLPVVAGELADARRNVARALVATAILITAVYLVVNVGYLVILPMEVLTGTDAPAAAIAETAIGPAGARIVAALVAFSAFGTLFGIAISGPRYAWAMARAGLFFRFAGRVDPRSAAPRAGATALFLTTMAYLLTGEFEQILGFYVAIHGLYIVLSLAAIWPLRRRDPDGAPFRAPGGPLLPAVAIIAMLGVTISEIVRAPLRTGAGIGVLLLSLPAWLLWRRFAVAGTRSVR